MRGKRDNATIFTFRSALKAKNCIWIRSSVFISKCIENHVDNCLCWAGADVPSSLAIKALSSGLGADTPAGPAASTDPSPPPASAASSTTTALVHEGELAAASEMMPIDFSTFDNAAFCSDAGAVLP